jgi:hypothetical protein
MTLYEGLIVKPYLLTLKEFWGWPPRAYENHDSMGKVATSVECKTDISHVLMDTSDLDPHMISNGTTR